MVSGDKALSADEALHAAVVRIGGANGTVAGGGFLVTADRVLTCAHVVSDALGRARDLPVAAGAEVLIDFPLADGAGERVVAEVEQWIPEEPQQHGDLAVLRLRGAVPGTRPLPIAASDEVSHRPVRVVGFPDDELGVVWHRGELSGKSAGDWIQLSRADSRTAHITAGYSGSPVWDERRGAAVGIVVASQRKRDDAQQSFAISVKAALGKLPDLDRELAGDPFLGIDTFQERHEEIFFGRDPEIGEVVAELELPQAVTLFGPSGCGKSSLALAGVVPRMRRGGGEDENDDRPAHDVVVVDAGAGGSLLSRLAVGLYEVVRTGRYGDRRAESVDQVREWLADEGLVETLNHLRAAGDGRCLVVLDQAEALLQLGQKEFDADAGLLFPKDGPKAGCPLLITLRSDFMDAALRHPRLGPLVNGTETMPLMPMSEGQLRDVITKPLEKAPAVVYEPGPRRTHPGRRAPGAGEPAAPRVPAETSLGRAVRRPAVPVDVHGAARGRGRAAGPLPEGLEAVRRRERAGGRSAAAQGPGPGAAREPDAAAPQAHARRGGQGCMGARRVVRRRAAARAARRRGRAGDRGAGPREADRGVARAEGSGAGGRKVPGWACGADPRLRPLDEAGQAARAPARSHATHVHSCMVEGPRG
nr:trypsin-like peptidase domain-containing protein [Streptomyces sp. HB202]